MLQFKQFTEERKTVNSHPYYVWSPKSYVSYRMQGRFKTEEEAKAHVEKIKPHMPGMTFEIKKGDHRK